jgi:maltooligosyltrehalose trehalohydrolase
LPSFPVPAIGATTGLTFLQSKLNRNLRHDEPHRTLLEFYQEVIELLRTPPGLAEHSRDHMEIHSDEEEHNL